MVEQQKKSKNLVKDISFRVAKAAVKAILVYLLYFFLAQMLTPLFEMMPGLMESLEVFVAVYIACVSTWARKRTTMRWPGAWPACATCS